LPERLEDRDKSVTAPADAALIKGLMRRTVEDVLTVGQALIRQKAALPHGSFLPWIEAEFGMSQSAAYRFINVAERFDSTLPNVGSLPLAALYELAAPSTPPEVQAEVERRISAGEIIGAADVKKLKQQAQEIVQQNAALTDANRDMNDSTSQYRLADDQLRGERRRQGSGSCTDPFHRRAGLFKQQLCDTIPRQDKAGIFGLRL
jgi:hypothetical protein